MFNILADAAAKLPSVTIPGPKGTALQLTPDQIQKLIQQQQSQAQAITKSPLAAHFPWLTHGIAALFIIAAVMLVVLLAVQTTKQEGLTGTLGGRVESSYRGRLGFDQQLSRLTSYIAISFVVLATLLTLTGI